MAYREFMSGRLIASDKHPGDRPVRLEETWICLFSMILLKVTRPEATRVWQYEQHFSGLKAGIEGAFHGVQAIWDTK